MKKTHDQDTILVVGARTFRFSEQARSSERICWWGPAEGDNGREITPENLRWVFLKRGLARALKIRNIAVSNGARCFEFGDESEIFGQLTRVVGVESDRGKETKTEVPILVREPATDNHKTLSPAVVDLTLSVDRVVDVPVNRIRPFVGQPRKYFDRERLLALGRSMLKAGQQVPIILVPVKDDPQHDYQLYDGERRWRAAKLVGKDTLRAIIAETMDNAKLFKGSAVCNFGRESHQAMEIALALKQIKEDEDLTHQELADGFARSVSWVTQHMSLLQLNSEVQKMLNPELPENQQITFSVALDIVKLPSDNQMAAARHILDHRLTLPQVRHYVRKLIDQVGASSVRRQRKPHDDYKILRNFLRFAASRVDQLLDLPGGVSVETLFRRRPLAEAEESIRILSSLILNLQKIQSSIKKEAMRKK